MPAPFAVADLFSKGRLARTRHHCANVLSGWVNGYFDWRVAKILI